MRNSGSSNPPIARLATDRGFNVSSFDNNSDKHKTSRPMELNPLSSPLLSKNMDRWAEVYFSGPPEKREQAIQELLRELAGDMASAGNPANVTGEQARRGTEDAAAPIAPSGPLPVRESVRDSALRNRPETWSENSEPRPFGSLPGSEIFTTPNRAQEAAPKPTSDTERLLAPILGSNNTLGWARGNQQLAADPSRLFLDHPSMHRRNGALTTAALAILVGTLFYVGCRETTAWLRIHAVPRSAAPETRSATASSTKNGVPSGQPDTGANPALGPPSAAAGSPKKESPSRTPADDKPNGASTIRAAQYQSAQNQTAQNSGPGTEELAKAKDYLNGTRGKPRDSSEAVKWLWQSVAKQNAAASLLLSDLYVKGDGVPQNCDQARLLLNAAARRGVPGAGERIRNLPSVGCP
jgi:hypothetical protein